MKSQISYRHGQTRASVMGEFRFTSFSIIAGESAAVTYTNNSQGSFWRVEPNDVIATISFQNKATFMSDVTLGKPTGSNSQSWNYYATWTVSLNATISDGSTDVDIPAVFSFNITHLGTTEVLKYGLDLDWSAEKDFPNSGGLTQGQKYTLVADDRCHIGIDGTEMTWFTPSNAQNKSFDFKEGSEHYATMDVTENYDIQGGASGLDTVRTFIAEQSIAVSGGIQSAIYVAYGGFEYNVSTGLEYDPTLVMYLPESTSIPGYNFAILAVSALFAVAFISMKMRVKK